MRSMRRSPQVEERCRQIRNVAPESAHHARRAWESRSLTMWRDEGRGMLRLTVEVPIEEGELIVRALDCAVAGGRGHDGRRSRRGRRVERHGVARAASRCARRGREVVSRRRLTSARAARRRITIKSSCTRTRNPSRGGAGCSDLPIETVKRLLCDCSLVHRRRGRRRQSARRRAQAAHGLDAAAGARSTRAIAAARSRAVTASGISTGIT